jgi:PAS domain S-box-containing protein
VTLARQARRAGDAAIRARRAPAGLRVAPRHLAAVVLVLTLTVTGFFVARALAVRDARRASEQRVEIAAAQIQSRLDEATSLTDSLQQFMFTEAPSGVTNEEFARNTLRWLLPAGLGAAAWVELLPGSDRPAFEQRLGHAIVEPGAQRIPAPRTSSYLPTALISGFPPLNARGVDLRREPGILTALHRALIPGNAGATPIATHRAGPSGLFLVARAPNVVDGVLRPGFVTLFVSETTLRAAAKNAPELRLSTARDPTAGFDPERTVRKEFTVAGQQFSVVLRTNPVAGASAILPWLILAGGLVLAVAAAALGVNAARRAKAQADLDRIFTLSPDMITVADFAGRFTRVNPATERVLGYSQEELLERPYLDFVQPEDREKTEAEAAALSAGSTTQSFENRYVGKDGTERVLEWTATPVIRDRQIYAVARDVTERRQTEIEQAALRRIATLVAEGVTGADLFEVVAQEAAAVFRVATVSIDRYDDDGASTVVASLEDPGFPVGSRWPLDGPSVGATVRSTGAPARIDDYSDLESTSAAAMRESGVNSAVGAPILVDGRPWGVICVASTDGRPVRTGTEVHLGRFADLLATAIARAESRRALAMLADEQAALRRVATLVAQGLPSDEIFASATREAEQLLGHRAIVARFEHEEPAIVIVGRSNEIDVPLGARWPLEDGMATSEVFRTGASARVDATDWSSKAGPVADTARRLSILSTVASPIFVGQRLWGAIAVSSPDLLPAETEARLERFTQLLSTAVSNTQMREDRRLVLEEQAALRRVATLVAHSAPRGEIFGAVSEEVGRLFGSETAVVIRFDHDDPAFVVAGVSSHEASESPAGTRLEIDEPLAASEVYRTGRSARIDLWERRTAGEVRAGAVRELGVVSTVASPITVEGRLWGAISVGSTERPLPLDTAARLEQFTELVATAISNSESRSQLAASRRRIVTASDEARRRIERDLHDGIQQRLLAIALAIQAAESAPKVDHDALRTELSQMAMDLNDAIGELQSVSRGIHPGILSRGGLGPALRGLARRSSTPVEVDVATNARYPEAVEVAAYFVVSVALANAQKHSEASHIEVRLAEREGKVVLSVRDDGIGGADATRGSGLIGLTDRVEALGGTIRVQSRSGAGTEVIAQLPVDFDAGAAPDQRSVGTTRLGAVAAPASTRPQP